MEKTEKTVITAALRALCQYYDVEVAPPVQAKLIQETETRELEVPAGPQDRVVQVYEGLVYMDFARELMESRGYGNYENMDPRLLPNMYVAYRTSLSEGTEVFHNNIRQRWLSGDTDVVKAMKTWATYAQKGRKALLDGDGQALSHLINASFDLRAGLYQISRGNLEMVRVAREVGATATFAGSGGAIVGTYADNAMFEQLQTAMKRIQVAVIHPQIEPPAPKTTASQ